MIGYYTLVGQTPVPCEDLLEWARWFEEGENRRVMYTTMLDTVAVSTVFLGLDHSFGNRGAPMLFESAVIWWDGEIEVLERCSTWEEAERMHRILTRHVARPGCVLRWCMGKIRDWWHDATMDWRQGIHQLRLE